MDSLSGSEIMNVILTSIERQAGDRFQVKTLLGSPVKFNKLASRKTGPSIGRMKITASSIGEPTFRLCKLYVSNLSLHTEPRAARLLETMMFTAAR